MPNLESIGRLIMIFGVVVMIVGGLVWLLGKLMLFEKLPGIVRLEVGGLTCIIPLLASILLSILLTVVLNILLRNINR